MDSGVATRPLPSLEAYRERMARFVYHSGNSMKPVFEAAKAQPKRVIYAEGEEERVLRAVQVVVDEGLAHPVLLGRADVIAQAHRGARPAPQARRQLRGRQHPQRSALSGRGGRILRAGPAQGITAGHRQGGDAQPRLVDRRHAAPARRCRRHAVRHGRHL